MKILVTGGTVFVSKYVATYFVEKGHEVYVLNRGSKEQVEGVKHIKADRSLLGEKLKNIYFDAVLDICAYNEVDIKNLLDGLGEFGDYIFISSSAVYPETLQQPFNEEQEVGRNKFWGDYGTNKIAAEKYLIQQYSRAYILRPPYLYGAMQNIYREPFVFDCAKEKRKFYVPKDGKMKMQFFDVEDLCRVLEAILQQHPKKHILNVGNREIVDINKYVELCYEVVGSELEKVYVTNQPNQRDYFCFADYEYILDITELEKLLPNQKKLKKGLMESYEWYCNNEAEVRKRPYVDFIDNNLIR